MIDNVVQELSSTSGAGAITLEAINGRQRFSDAFSTGGSNTFYYSILNRSAQEWEVGIGSLSDATTLVRDTVLASSNGGAHVNFTAGTKDVLNGVPESDTALLSDLASTANGFGASLIGIEDSGGLFSATTVEGALAENRTAVDAIESTAAYFVDTRAALQGLDTSAKTLAYVKEDKYEGWWHWDSSDLSATLVTDTFATTSIDDTTDIITKVAHGLRTGDGVTVDAAVNGLSTNTVYYVYAIDADTFKLATLLGFAYGGGPYVDLTATTNVNVRKLLDPRQYVYAIPTGGQVDGSGGAWVFSQAVPTGNEYLSAAARYRRFNDRVIIGPGAAFWNGQTATTGGTGMWPFDRESGATQGMDYIATNAQLLSVTEGGDAVFDDRTPYAIVGMSRTKEDSGAFGAIGVTGYAKGRTTGGAGVAWGGYFDAVRDTSANTTVCGIEVEITDLNSTSVQAYTPYSSYVQGRTHGVAIGCGASTGVNPTSYDASSAINVFFNGAAFQSGLVFRSTALTQDGSGYQHAVLMPTKALVEWFVSDDISAGQGFKITSEVTNVANLAQITATDTGIEIDAAALMPAANDGGSLGLSGTAWSDAFFATGGTLNFGAGNAVITHSAGVLNVSTGTLQQGGSPVLLDSDIGSTVQAYDADLTTWAGITPGTGVGTALAVNVGTAGAFVVNGGALGTPSSGTLTNATGLPISTGVSGLGPGVATFLASPTSANLASAVTGETGSGALVFGTSPGFTTAANPVSNDGASLGTTALQWSDLFLASGGVINWANGGVTITETSDALAFQGAANGYTFADGHVGIGVTPSEALDVLGNFRLANTAADATLKLGNFLTRNYDSSGEPEGWAFAYTQGFSAVNYLYLGGGNANYNAATTIFFNTAATVSTRTGTTRASIDANGNFAVGTAALATTATNGFLYIPTCAGTPTGTPTAKTGLAALVYDSTNNLLYVNDGGGWVAANSP